MMGDFVGHFFFILLNRSDGIARFVEKSPDRATSLVVTAFSIDALNGLRLTEQSVKVGGFISVVFLQMNNLSFFKVASLAAVFHSAERCPLGYPRSSDRR